MTPTKQPTGEAKRNEGCQRVAQRKPAKSLGLQLLILEKAAQGQEFTIDDVLNPADEAKRSNATGAAMLAVSKKKLIRKTGERRVSQHGPRHAGENPVWKAVDVAACEAAIVKLRDELSKLASPAVQGTLFQYPAQNGGV